MNHYRCGKYKTIALFLSTLLFLQNIACLTATCCAQNRYTTLEKNENETVSDNTIAEAHVNVENTTLPLHAASALLMEASTGTVILAQNENEQRSPASITKIMTLLLTFEAIEKGKINLDDEVCISAYAQSMGGSQVYLEEGEKQSVDTLIKCVAVASGNDAAVALAEHIAGSEQAFVEQMNQKASMLGLTHTHFLDCCGLTDDDSHYTSALDVAKMSRELMMRYPQIKDYTTIWMENITHDVRGKTSEFTLSSTNKLLKQFPYTTGLKTGSTSKAGYCFSATAKKDDLELIAVIMGADTPTNRFSQAKDLLTYGFGICKLYADTNGQKTKDVVVEEAIQNTVSTKVETPFHYVDITGTDLTKVKKTYQIKEHLCAPIEKGEEIGKVVYSLDGKEIGSVPIVAAQSVAKATYKDYLKKVVMHLIL